jgi:hypothetical protein
MEMIITDTEVLLLLLTLTAVVVICLGAALGGRQR